MGFVLSILHFRLLIKGQGLLSDGLFCVPWESDVGLFGDEGGLSKKGEEGVGS